MRAQNIKISEVWPKKNSKEELRIYITLLEKQTKDLI